MADSPPNPRYPGYYSGPATTRLLAGAGPGEADMEDVANAWGNQAPQPPVPEQPPPPPPDRTDQLIQQMALLRDENLRLQTMLLTYDSVRINEGDLGHLPTDPTRIIT